MLCSLSLNQVSYMTTTDHLRLKQNYIDKYSGSVLNMHIHAYLCIHS